LLFCIELFTNPVRNIIIGFQGTMLVSDIFHQINQMMGLKGVMLLAHRILPAPLAQVAWLVRATHKSVDVVLDWSLP
jgi:hypothetical protein